VDEKLKVNITVLMTILYIAVSKAYNNCHMNSSESHQRRDLIRSRGSESELAAWHPGLPD